MLYSTHPALEQAAKEAENRMGKSEWTAAAELYKQLLDRMDPKQNPFQTADITERIAKCHFKAAFQSDKRTDFKRTMRLSQESQEKTALLYERPGSQALAKRALSRALYANFWQSDDPDDRRSTIHKCIEFAQQAVEALEAEGNKEKLSETLLDLQVFLEKAAHLSTERKQLVELFEGALEIAWRIIEELEGVASDETTLQSIDTLVQMYSRAENILEPPRYEELERKLGKLKSKIFELRDRIGSINAEAIAAESSGLLAADLEGDTPTALGHFERGVSKANEIRDHYLVGRLKTHASGNLRFLALSQEYVEKRRDHLEQALDFASVAIENLQASLPGTELKVAYSRYVDASTLLALQVETDYDKKRALLQRTIEFTRKGISNEKLSFFVEMRHALSKATYFLATMDVGPEEKSRLLSEALPLRQDTLITVAKFYPHSWERGVMLNYSALLKTELSKLEETRGRKLELLNQADSDMDQCVKVCATLAGLVPAVPGQIRVQAQYNESHGDVLLQLYNLTADASNARRAITAFEDTISYLSKSNSAGPIPGVRWKIAQTYDSLRDYNESSRSFQSAASEYRLAGKKLPRLAPTFEDFATYMDAWALIEEARQKHGQEMYGTAADNYTEAANKLKTIKAWSHLSNHYSACSLLELGEVLSSRERQRAAIETFKEAQATFQDAESDLQSKLNLASQPQEKRELSDWLDITQGRLKYSLARIQLEDARVLDTQGEAAASSSKYLAASEAFGSLFSEARDDHTRRELEALTQVCTAWAKMKTAESTSSPELYAEAAESFSRVEKTAYGRRSQLTALANASICKALESGTLFRRTGDKALYAEIKKRLETAASFYEEAGVKTATDWTRATQRFFDALTFLGEAEAQVDPRKKTEFYDLAEKQLQLAAKLYDESGYSKRKEETLRLLQRARGERELFLASMKVLDGSPALRETTFSPLSFTPDRAMGLERFEVANIVGSARTDKNVIEVGSEVIVDLEMANVGKTAATLLKVENVTEEGLELVPERIDEKIEERYIDMRGRRLEHLKTHELKLPIRARVNGNFQLRPRILYVDEKGVYRSFEFESIRLVVTEVASGGLLESERRLSAIMFTDIVGFTSTTEQNEALALELLAEHRTVLRPLFPRYSGKEIKTVGDMFLVEFASALDAVRCAMRIQETLSKRNLESPGNKRVQIRIGVHVGDVEHSHGDVYGEAVNVASRIEPLAEPGGIVVTRQVYDQIRNRPGIKMESMGNHKLKNVKESLEVFKVSS